MIEIICDSYGIYKSEDYDIFVKDSSQYEDAISMIKKNALEGKNLRVIVSNPALFDWFDAAIKYGAQKCIINPITELANNLQQFVVPDYLKENPGWIVELNLLDKSQATSTSGESIDIWLKKVLLGSIWGDEEPHSINALSEFFNFFLNNQEASLHPLQKCLLEKQLNHWSLNSQKNTKLFEWLKSNTFNRAKAFIWEQQLHLFPENKIAAWLQQDHIWYELSKFPDRHYLPSITLSIPLPKNIAAFAREFLVDEWKSSADKALSFISGTFDFEKKFLLERLHHQLQDEIPISSSLFEKIIEFQDFPEVINLSRQLLPVRKPSLLSMDCSIKLVQNWMANEYLPFYNSCSLLGQLELTKPYIEAFEKWLERHYTNMLFDEAMAYRQIIQVKECVLASEPILMVVFDGLDYLCACDELLPVMQKKALFPINDPIPFFAFLPTHTNISKPTLVAGKMRSQIPNEVPKAYFYKELLQDYLGIPEKNIRSGTDHEGTILELLQEPTQVYLFLDNYLDRELLHKNYRQHLRKKKYAEYIRKQAETIIQCMKDFKDMYGKSLQVVVCSDHGYTVIPKDASILEVPTINNGKTRTILSSDVVNLKTLDEKNIWKLNPHLYGLSHEKIIPRGYACFNKRPHGATHGGCSPQEMAVPWFVFNEEKPAALKNLIFSFEGEIFRKRKENHLTINISNPNNYKITIIEMEIKGMDVSSVLPLTINKNAIGTFQCPFNASAIAESHVNFSIKYYLKSLAGKSEEIFNIKVPTTGAMSTGFDDDFDF